MCHHYRSLQKKYNGQMQDVYEVYNQNIDESCPIDSGSSTTVRLLQNIIFHYFLDALDRGH